MVIKVEIHMFKTSTPFRQQKFYLFKAAL